MTTSFTVVSEENLYWVNWQTTIQWCYLQLVVLLSSWGFGHDVCSPLQDGLFITWFVTLLVLCLVLAPHVADHELQSFHEHVTYLHWPNDGRIRVIQYIYKRGVCHKGITPLKVFFFFFKVIISASELCVEQLLRFFYVFPTLHVDLYPDDRTLLIHHLLTLIINE